MLSCPRWGSAWSGYWERWGGGGGGAGGGNSSRLMQLGATAQAGNPCQAGPACAPGCPEHCARLFAGFGLWLGAAPPLGAARGCWVGGWRLRPRVSAALARQAHGTLAYIYKLGIGHVQQVSNAPHHRKSPRRTVHCRAKYRHNISRTRPTVRRYCARELCFHN